MKKLILGVLAWVMSASMAFAAVNVNTATREQLDALKGIGPVKAQAIIDYRTKNGPFKSVDDLEKVPGIGPATMKDIRNDVTIGGATTGAAAPAKNAATAVKGKNEKVTVRQGDATTTVKSDGKKTSDKADAKKAADRNEPNVTRKDGARPAKGEVSTAKDEKKTDKK